MIDSYTAATLVRSAPAKVRDAIYCRWEEMETTTSSTKSFLQTVSQVLGRSRGRAGLHLVQFSLGPHNTRSHPDPNPTLKAFFNSVERGLLIRELTAKGSMRKNGFRIPRASFVSYNEGGLLCIGKIISIYVGSRHAAPYEPGCSVCVIRRSPPENSNVKHAVDCGMRIVQTAETRLRTGPLDYVCSTRLLHLYAQIYWPLSDNDGHVALVRMEKL